MKPEEASQKIKYSYIPKMFTALEEALEVAIQALEKQAPKSYDIRCNASGVCYDCPECGVKIDRYDKYCFNCGQKINWEETP